jgi:hypothetical protein
MGTAAKPGSQPRTESCVMSGNVHCEAETGSLLAGTTVKGNIAPKSIFEVADIIPVGEGRNSGCKVASVLSCFRGSYRRHAIQGFYGNKGEPSGSSVSL